MKQFIVLIAIVFFSISSQAQISFGGQIGANLGMGHQTNDVDDVFETSAAINDPKIGFLVGVVAEIDFGKLGFRPELNFVQKGSKSGSVNGYAYDDDIEKFTLNYLEIPLNVVYNLKVGRAGKVFFGLGPAIGIGLSGTDKFSTYDDNGDRYSGKIKIKFDGKENANDGNGHFKRIDIGANVLGGIQLPMGFFAKVGFTYGFTNISPYKDFEYKNRGVSLCVGYMLGGK